MKFNPSHLGNTSINGLSLISARNWIALVGAMIFAYELFQTAWLGDDVGFTIRTILNLVNGYGPVFNVGERVQAYTHPLWFLVLSLLISITGNVFLATFFCSISLSLASIVFLARNLSTTLGGCLLSVSGLIFSKSYIDYSTSGLENPLSHACMLAAIYFAFKFDSNRKEKSLILFLLTSSLLFLTRQDLILCIAPLLIFILYRAKTQKFPYKRALVIALVPILCWETFSLVYYGFPFPNTAYAKLGSAISHAALFEQGLFYFQDLILSDPLTFFAIALGLCIAVRGESIIRYLGLGVIIYLAYLLYIGGDFMSGRFFTAPLLCMSVVISRTQFSPAGLYINGLLFSVLAISNSSSTLLSSSTYVNNNIRNGIADERGVYYQSYGLRHIFKKNPIFISLPMWAVGDNQKTVKIDCTAFSSIVAGPQQHLIDYCALADPLLARMPAREDRAWRIGHFFRQLPLGYIETIQQGRNLIYEADVRKYYEYLKLVIEGPLVSLDRFAAIFYLNLGLVGKPVSGLVEMPEPYLYELVSRLTPKTIGQTIQFSKEDITPGAWGWQWKEGWGVWSNGKNARIALIAPYQESRELLLNVRSLVANSLKCQRVYISVNGINAGDLCLSSSEGNEIRIPLSTFKLQSGGLIVINFDLPDAISPKELGISNTDERILAIGLKSAHFY